MNDLPVLEEKIPALIRAARPARLLAIGSLAEALARPAVGEESMLTCLPAAEAGPRVAAGGHQDMAIIAGELDALGAVAAAQVLARLRDLYAAWVIVITDSDHPPPGLSHRDLVALGFTLLGDALHDGAPVHVHEFDMATYKTTPDWLNSRYWANPELWDKYRW